MTRAKAAAAKSQPGIEANTRQSLKHLKAAIETAAKRPEREDSIHDLRVSIRRFKQVLRVYSDSLNHTRKMRRSLGGIMDLCGEARNCDIALTVLESAGFTPERSLKKALAKRRAEATGKLARELKDWDARSTLRRWRRWLAVKDSNGAAAPAVPDLSPEFRKTGAAAARGGAPYRQMHQFRLLVKKIRYANEILGGPESRVEALRALQDLLGEINDCVATGELMADLKIAAASQRRVRAALNRLAEKRSEEFRAYWRAHYGRKGPAPKRRTK